MPETATAGTATLPVLPEPLEDELEALKPVEPLDECVPELEEDECDELPVEPDAELLVPELDPELAVWLVAEPVVLDEEPVELVPELDAVAEAELVPVEPDVEPEPLQPTANSAASEALRSIEVPRMEFSR